MRVRERSWAIAGTLAVVAPMFGCTGLLGDFVSSTTTGDASGMSSGGSVDGTSPSDAESPDGVTGGSLDSGVADGQSDGASNSLPDVAGDAPIEAPNPSIRELYLLTQARALSPSTRRDRPCISFHTIPIRTAHSP
jgi:hypothetical protein